MKTEIFDVKSNCWSTFRQGSASIAFSGSIWIGNNYHNKLSACKQLIDLLDQIKSINEVMKELKNISGHFALIFSNENYTIAIVDKIRSIPVFYCMQDDNIYLSTSATELKQKLNLSTIDYNALLQFKMSGYTLGENTLYKTLHQLSAGQFLYTNHQCLEIINYFVYKGEQINNRSEKELIEELNYATLITFNKMIDSLKGRPVYIPLSGGLDSRLILAMLKELKYDNIVTYSYGIKGVWEIKRAKYIADLLNTKWIFVEFKRKTTKQLFYSEDRKKYFQYAGAYHSAPHLAEYYALLYLIKENKIPEDAIIINGQSGDFTSGGHIPGFLSKCANEELDTELLTSTIIDKHFSLWNNLKTENNKAKISKFILDYLGQGNKQTIESEKFSDLYEFFECHERQSKYVVNGQRAYEWLDFAWRLPFWSDELMEFWRSVPWNIKIGQNLLIKYLAQTNPGGVFNKIELPAQYSYFPFWIKMIRPIVSIANSFSGNDIDYNNKYLKFFMTYAPLYPQKRYIDFLKDSKWHRNPVSYWSESYLKENNIKPFVD